jgi:hypothetical protein
VKYLRTLKLSIWDVLPDSLTLSFAHIRMSESVISLSLEWNLKFFSSCRMLVLMSCHRKAGKEYLKTAYNGK